MTVFAYKAVDARGRTVRGEIDTPGVTDLDLRLRRMGLDLVTGRPARKFFARSRGGVRRVDLINVCFHLEQFLAAGVPLIESLADLRDSLPHRRLREVLSEVIESIHGGASLSQAMAHHPRVFGEVFRSLVRAGEDAGRLPDVLKSLIDTLKWEDELAAQMRRLTLYPALIGVIVLSVTVFVATVLVPQVAAFMRNMGQSVPIETRLLIAFSEIVAGYWWALLATPVAIVVSLHALARAYPAVRFRRDALLLSLPVVGKVLQKIIFSRVAGVFALMYASGITVLDAVRGAEAAAGNRVIADGLRIVARQIGEGRNVAAAFQGAGLFPPLVIRMLHVGETTGALDAALASVRYFYDREVRESIARMQVMIEPVLTAFLGLVLGWVMLAALGPIYDVIAKLKI